MDLSNFKIAIEEMVNTKTKDNIGKSDLARIKNLTENLVENLKEQKSSYEMLEPDINKIISPIDFAKLEDINWNEIPTGHKKCIRFLTRINEINHGFWKYLLHQEKTKVSVVDYHYKIIKDNKEEFSKTVNNANKNCDNKFFVLKDKEAKRIKIIDAIAKICVDFNDVVSKVPFAPNIKANIDDIVNKSDELKVLVNKKIALYDSQYNAEKDNMANASKKANSQIDDAARELNQKINDFFYNERTELCKKMNGEISRHFSTWSMSEYFAENKQSFTSADEYECPTEVPNYIMLGEAEMRIAALNNNYYNPFNNKGGYNRVIKDINGRLGNVWNVFDKDINTFSEYKNNELYIKVPYVQSLTEGISLMMRYSQDYRVDAQKLMQPLLLKLFMSIPAGRLEATMIDPLEMGKSFVDIPKLAAGPNSARIIDTKIWSNPSDIDQAISTMRDKLENMIQAYGDDHISRLKKEVIRVLAITDFPKNFNDNALNNLQAIIRNNAALGVCVFICVNKQAMESLKDSQAQLVDEIMQNVVLTDVCEDGLRYIDRNEPGEIKKNGMFNNIILHIDEMQDIMVEKDKVINKIADVIDHMQLRVEYFDSMYEGDIYNSNTWFKGTPNEVAIPLGIKGANTIVKMILGRGGGSTEHHALLAGQTGAGKTTLLHTLILSTMISYKPEEVQLYILDFKEGVEFNVYTRYRLPSLRVVAINSEREFGLNVLAELCSELENRTKIFNRHGVADINAYYKLDNVAPVPKLLLLFDEVQELFRNASDEDKTSKECLSYINKLVMQGRAMGIHIIFACQDFRNCSGLEAYFTQMAIRIAVKGSEDGASSILNENNSGIHVLQNQPAGAAIYNNGGGVESANNFFQVSYMEEEKRIQLLECLDAYYTEEKMAKQYAEYETRVLMTNAEDDINNQFNDLIKNGAANAKRISKHKNAQGLIIGQGFSRRSMFIPELITAGRDNLLITTKNEKMAMSISMLSAMSILQNNLSNGKSVDDTQLYIIDLSNEEIFEEREADFDYLSGEFEEQIKAVDIKSAADTIETLYNKMNDRIDEGKADSRICLIFFGIHRARRLTISGIDLGGSDDMEPIEKLQKLLITGPKVGINSIVWTDSVRGIEKIIPDGFANMFNKRIAYGLDDDDMDNLVMESDSKNLGENTAVYMDVDDIKNTHFRPYEIPDKVWISNYAKAYKK